jgi:SAM-dependent methyltransferase
MQERQADAQAPNRTAPPLSALALQRRRIFEQAYDEDDAPWVIGEPQPAVVALERDGWIRGTVLDPGCGTGEHTILLTRLGYDVRGIDSSEIAVERARANAAEHRVACRFEVADAMYLADEPTYDTVLDSALFHTFDPADRIRYVRSLHLACHAGALVHVLALASQRVSDTVIRDAFADGWALEELRPSTYRCVVDSEGEVADRPAWQARVRRI